MDSYPHVAVEEAQLLLEWLSDFARLPSGAIARYASEVQIDSGAIRTEVALVGCLNWLFLRIEAFCPEFWPTESQPLSWNDLPDWVHELYDRAHLDDANKWPI